MALASLVARRCIALGRGQLAHQSRSAISVSYTDMGKSKHDFVQFTKEATLNPGSAEGKEMHDYLMKCFFDADTDYDGLVSYQGFNKMIGEAAAVPRRFGFAPHTREMYSSKEQFETERTKMYQDLCKGEARLSLEQWLGWAKPHILSKAKDLVVHDEARWDRSKEDCISFFKEVAKQGSDHNKKTSQSTQLKEFYVLCQQQFVAADEHQRGVLGKEEFEKLLAKAAAVTKKFGLDWYSTVKFSDVASNGVVTWASWFSYSVKLVSEKSATA